MERSPNDSTQLLPPSADRTDMKRNRDGRDGANSGHGAVDATAAGKASRTERLPGNHAAAAAAVQMSGLPPRTMSSIIPLSSGIEYVDSLIGPASQPTGEADLGVVQRRETSEVADVDVHAAAAAGVQGPGGSLPFMDIIQQSFGEHDVSGIQSHVGGPAAEASSAIGAYAYATGSHVAFGKAPDLHTAAHEAAHVVQQRAGVQLKGGVGSVGDPYERHADAVADAVVGGAPAQPILDQMVGGADRVASGDAVQRRVRAPGGGDLLSDSIRYLEERASEMIGQGKPGPREQEPTERVDDIASAADMVSDQLATSKDELDDATKAALRHAVARLAEVGQRVGGDGAARLRVARERVSVAAAARGLDVRAPLAGPGGSTPLGGEADDARLLDGLEHRIGLLVQSLEIHTESPDADHLVAPVSDAILVLMKQAEGVIRGADTRDLERFSQQVLRISSHTGLLFRRARGAEVSLLATSLPDVFEHEDRLLKSVGAASALRFRAYHGDQRANKDDPTTSGEALIESIIDQFTNAVEVHQSAIAVVASALQEPESSPSPSLLEEVMLTVVSDLIGGLPGHFGKVLERVAKAVDGTRDPSAAAGGGAEAKSGSLLSLGLFNTARKIVAFGAGEAKQGAKDSIASLGGKASASMKTRFITDCHLKTIAYMSGPLHQQAQRMKPLLQRVAPDQLKVIEGAMSEGLRVMFEALIQDLLAQWMNFRAGIALGGVDARGDLAMDGSLQNVVERPGSVKVRVGLRDGAAAQPEVLGIDVDGVGPAVLRELSKGPDTPLIAFPVHRYFTLMGPPTGGGRKVYGEIYLNASGALRVDGVHDRVAVASVGLAQRPADATDAEVEGGARRILAGITLTAKDLA